jgi:hypothetical protein
MEVSETAACGIAQREFAIEFDVDELVDMYRILRYAQNGTGFYDEDFLADLKSQLAYIIGPSLEEEPGEEIETELTWEDNGVGFTLSFKEEVAATFYQILEAVEHPAEGLDTKLNANLLDQMMEMAPNTLDNLPVINR